MFGQASAKKLYAKCLPAQQAVSVLAVKMCLKAKEDAHLMSVVAELATRGCRPATVVELTKIPPLVAKRLCEREKGGPTMGRTPTSIGPLMASIEKHRHASLFMRLFASFWSHSTKLDGETFLNAWREYQRIVTFLGDPQEISTEHALLLAQVWLGRKAVITTCPECAVNYVQSTRPIQVGKLLSCGDCPNCRQISMEVADDPSHARETVTLASPARTKVRKTIRDLTVTGKNRRLASRPKLEQQASPDKTTAVTA